MSQKAYEDKIRSVVAVEELAKANLLRKNPRLDYALENSDKNGLPPIAVSPLQGKFLAVQCQLIGAKSVLEIGTLGGYGTIWLAESGAKVTSIEIDPKFRDVALENTKGLDVEIILGAALDVLPRLASEGRQFDVVLIDAAWGEQWDYFDWAVKLTRPKGLVYVDNVVRNLIEGGAADGGKESLVTKIGKDERVTATLVPVVSYYEEGHEDVFDGFIMAVTH